MDFRFSREDLVTSPISIVTLVIVGILVVVFIWQMIIWMLEIQDKNRKYKAATEYAQKSGKQLLVIGGPWGVKSYRRLLDRPAHGNGDVCLDIDRRALESHPCAVVASCTDIHSPINPLAQYSAVTFWNICRLRKWRTGSSEMNRVAGAVFIAYPSRQSLAAWIIRDHHIWVWQKDGKLFLDNARIESPGSIKLLKQPTKSVSDVPDITAENPQLIVEAASQLAAKLFPGTVENGSCFLIAFRKSTPQRVPQKFWLFTARAVGEMRIGIICRTGKRAL